MSAAFNSGSCLDATTIAAFGDGSLDVRLRRGVVGHAAICASCRAAVLTTIERARPANRTPLPHPLIRSLIPALIASAVVIALGAALWFREPRGTTLEALAEASADLSLRTTDARLPGGFPYRPFRAGSGKEARSAIAQLRGERAARMQTELAGRGLAYLLVGDAERAVPLLERAVLDCSGEVELTRAIAACNDADLLTSAAAAFHERGAADGIAVDLVVSLDAAERASTLKQSPEIAWNRAVALESLHLRAEAAASWSQYRELDPASQWAEEAQRREAALRIKSRAEQWTETRRQIEGDLPPATQLAPFPVRGLSEHLRDYIEEELLPAWADAVRVGNDARASELLARSKWVAHRLCDEGGECLVLDGVLAIERLERSDPRRIRAAGAFEEWARGTAAGKLRPDVRDVQLRRAISTMRALHLPTTARVEMRIAAAHFDANEWQQGLAQLDALTAGYAPALARSPLLRGQIEWYRGMFLIATGRAGEALYSYQRALAELEAIDVDTGAGMLELLIAENLRHVGAFEEAWNHHLRAIDRLGRTGEGFRLIMAVSSAGKTAAREHSDRVALVLHEAAVRLAARERQPEFECHALVSRAQVVGVSPADSARFVREAEEAWNRIPDAATRRRFVVELEMARALSLARTSPAAAVEVLTRARGLAIEHQDPFRFARVHLQRASLYEQLQRPDASEADLRSGIEEIERQRGRISDEGQRGRFIETGDELFSALARNLVDRRLAREAFEVSEQRRARVLREKVLARRATAVEGELSASLQRAMPPDAAIVEYLWMSDRILYWVVTQRSVEAGHLPAPRRVERMIRRVLEDPGSSDLADLYDQLVRPINLEGVQRLVFVPDGPLHRIPFAALYDRRQERHLIEKAVLTVLPSAALALSAAQSNAPRASAALLIVADPEVAPRYAQEAPALPGARREAALRTLFDDAVLLTRSAATPARFLELGEHAEVIHFAGHTLGGGATRAAALALTPDASEPDGLVGAADLEKHTFAHARLVVLAACSTSTGRVGSEGSMSLARAFLAAGAGNVVATLWPVDDEATARLWPVFYQSWIRGASPAEALRDAQLSLLRDSRHRNPRNWAAFQVIGPT